MAIKIDEDCMTLEIDGRVAAIAEDRAGGWWQLAHWARFLDRDQAITALRITEFLGSGYGRGEPLVIALREGLR